MHPCDPEQVKANNDPGDDVARRFRYQWTYAGIICCLLFDEDEGVVAVFCEHHEDVLIKYVDQTFSGVQIKTREADQDLWRTNDESLQNALARFCKLEKEFSQHFRDFRFVTNHPLYSAVTSRSLHHFLATIKECPNYSALDRGCLGLLKKIAKLADCALTVALTAMKKTSASDALPKFADVDARLISTLVAVWPGAEIRSHAAVVNAALNLTNECGRASSLAHEGLLPGYLAVVTNPSDVEYEMRLQAKRFDKTRVDRILLSESHLASLETPPDRLIDPGAGSDDLLQKKLEAAGFSAVSQVSAQDLRDKADYLGILWTKKYGRTAGLQRYSHIQSLVLSDAARAFETSKVLCDPFGPEMLSDLRRRFQERRALGTQLYECMDEHLEGVSYSLTSQCKIQWSICMPWEND